MASRRLAISSLLCDGEDKSNRAELQDNHCIPPSPAVTHQPVAVRSYASPVRSAFDATQSPVLLSNTQYEAQYRRETFERSPTPPSPAPYVLSRSITPLPLALQPVVLHGRTPSPPPMSLPASPEPLSATTYNKATLEDKTASSSLHYLDSRDFQSHNGLEQRADPVLSPVYSHYEPPFPPPSPVDINRHAQQSRRAALQMSSYDYSRPHSQIPDSPAAESGLTHAHLPSVSPQTTTISPPHSVDSFQTRQITPRNEYEHQHRSTSYPQQLSFPAHRSSASVSPTISKNTGPSGLDVLVQAATEERERIDESRRLSGGGISRYSPESSRLSMDDRESTQIQSRGNEDISVATLQETFSPPTLRNNVRLQPTSPKNSPRSAPVMPSSYGSAFPTSPVTLQHLVDSPPRIMKRTRLSPETMPVYGEANSMDNGRQTLPTAHIKHGSKVQVRTVSDPEKSKDTRADPTSQSAQQLQRSQLQASGGLDLKPESGGKLLSGVPLSQSLKSEIHLAEDANAVASGSRIPSGIKPSAVRNAIPVGRRSPPRSRPKPKKPGSAALASMEHTTQESVSLKPMDIDRTSVAKPVSSSSQASSSKPRRVPSSKSAVAAARKKVEDEDSTDFFLSAISSPKEPQEVKLPAFESTSPKVQAKQRPSPNNKPRTKQSRKSALAIDTSRSPTSEILDQIISPSSDDLDNGRVEYENKGYHSANYIDDIDDELANAVASTTDGDEGYPIVSEVEEPDTDAMEVDVENELLSLLEDQVEVTTRPVDQAAMPAQSAKHAMAPSLSTSFDRPSMPPPDVLNTAGPVTKPGKKDTGKSKGKAKARPEGATIAAKASKQAPGATEETIEKVSKPKTSKPRPPKGSSVDKLKQLKTVKDAHSPAPATQRGSSIDPGGGGTPVDEAFPLVTSSGRMVTKSKKVAAAANAVHPTTHSKKKTPVTSTTQQEGSNEARSRSHSVMPRASVDPESQREKSAKAEETKAKAATEEAEADEDDKLYCICKTKYDEDRVMIACDRCDDWYHTQCIDMPDLDIDLVDQFICPLCIERNPNLQLRTTYKQRCFSGLNHPKPKSADACHKPSRGAFSKYCSDECGVKFMHRKAQAWASKGGDVQSLWATVKDAKRREGVVTAEPHRTVPRSILAALQNSSVTSSSKELVNGAKLEPAFDPTPKRNENANAALIKTLQTQLDSISKQRESWKKEMDLTIWRERLLILAAERASRLKECGWDQRLCFGDEEVMEFGDGVLESYDESVLATKNEEENGMDVDEQVGEGEWWCRGKQKCERHAGWQKLRISEIRGEKEMKDDALVKLTSREREIRGRIEDILHPQINIMNSTSAPKLEFKVVNGRKSSDDGPKKGKKKNSSAL